MLCINFCLMKLFFFRFKNPKIKFLQKNFKEEFVPIYARKFLA